MNFKDNLLPLWNKAKDFSSFPAVVLFIILFIINIFVMNNMLSNTFLVSFLNTNTAVICLSIGASAVIISGEIDISLGAMVSVINVLLIKMQVAQIPFQTAVLLALLAAMLMGFLNGFLVAVLRGSSLLMTFATSKIFGGLALLIMPVPGGSIARQLSRFYRGKFLGIPATLLFILVPYIIWKIFKATSHGTHLYATGQDRNKAFTSGVNVIGEKLFAMIFAGLCAGIGGVALTSSIGAGDPLIGSALAMTALSAAVIGGVSLSGGYGDVGGGIFACLFLGLITVLVLSAGVNAYMQQFVSALILLVGIIGAIAFKQIREKRELYKKEDPV
jgi:ribose transport system permease protein